ncbi:MoaD/ThiS family protein [Parapedobacter koreensis]|uniref:Molybdopterin synthase subunit MoaD n=1 Tax=Parapedobacter koreensis TaxID=332977 RepID=A0A1H7MQE5_9SPHI|nr:MoaD/ThiS family protein [Parapedobacter koreensis]SEL13414.1 molybdopterin synthase subunit MoaD [Parapedobacter koreensis]
MVNGTLSLQFFGRLMDLTGCSTVSVPMVGDTDELRQRLFEQYPALREATYVVAVDRKIVRQNTPLTEAAEIALLPPFSGG